MRLRPRAGIALLATLLGVLVLELVIAGTMHLALTQMHVARARVRTVQLDAAARSAAADALAAWAGLRADALAVGATRTLEGAPGEGGITTSVALRRVQPTLYFLHVAAESPIGGRRAVGVLLRTAEASDFLHDITAAATAPRAAGHGSITGLSACADAADLPALLLTMPAGAESLVLSGSPDWQRVASLPDAVRLAGLDLDALLPHHAAASFVMQPRLAEAACDEAALSNWGAPGQPHACSDYFPLRAFAGDVVIAGGDGQGILVSAGAVTLGPGARFHGLIIAAGPLRLMPGAELHGAGRSDTLLDVDGGTIVFDPCALARAFSAPALLRGPFLADPHWFLPLS